MSRYKELADVLAGVTETHDMQRLMQELLTPKELEDIGRRWQILKDLYAGISQREIAERHKMSLCKVTRGSKVLQSPGSVCKAMIEKRIKK